MNNTDKKEYTRNIDILKKHKEVVENQKWAYNHIINNLDNESCVLILDFKENFKYHMEAMKYHTIFIIKDKSLVWEQH